MKNSVKNILFALAAVCAVAAGIDYFGTRSIVGQLAAEHGKEKVTFGVNVAHSTTNITGGHTDATTSVSGFMSGADKKAFSKYHDEGARSYYYQSDDFLSGGENSSGAAAITVGHTFGVMNWRPNFTGAGGAGSVTFVSTNQDSTHEGILNLSPGTTTTGVVAMGVLPASTPGEVFGSGQVKDLEFVYRTSALSDGTTTYADRIGWQVGTGGGVPTDSFHVEYSSGAPSSGNFLCRICASSVCSTVSGGGTVTVAANTWYRIHLTATNATTASCSVDGSSIGSATVTFPTAAVGKVASRLKSAGAGNPAMFLDKAWAKTVYDPTTAP